MDLLTLRQNISNWLEHFSARDFGFEVWCPLEECAARLESKSERKPGFLAGRNTLLIKVLRVDAKSYRFSVERDAGRGLNVEVIGTLRRQDERLTVVSGQARISNPPFVFFVCWTALWIVLTVAAHFYLFTIFGAFVSFGLWRAMVRGRDQLQDTVREFLSS